jgi:hypothetical protein
MFFLQNNISAVEYVREMDKETSTLSKTRGRRVYDYKVIHRQYIWRLWPNADYRGKCARAFIHNRLGVADHLNVRFHLKSLKLLYYVGIWSLGLIWICYSRTTLIFGKNVPHDVSFVGLNIAYIVLWTRLCKLSRPGDYHVIGSQPGITRLNSRPSGHSGMVSFSITSQLPIGLWPTVNVNYVPPSLVRGSTRSRRRVHSSRLWPLHQ